MVDDTLVDDERAPANFTNGSFAEHRWIECKGRAFQIESLTRDVRERERDREEVLCEVGQLPLLLQSGTVVNAQVDQYHETSGQEVRYRSGLEPRKGSYDNAEAESLRIYRRCIWNAY